MDASKQQIFMMLIWKVKVHLALAPCCAERSVPEFAANPCKAKVAIATWYLCDYACRDESQSALQV